jgi:hypothetical protein
MNSLYPFSGGAASASQRRALSSGASCATAAVFVVLVSAACRNNEAPRAIDAAPPPIDAPPIDAPLPIDAAARPAPAPTRIVASGDTTCAILSDRTVRCWGGNSHGQLGNSATSDADAPVAPPIRAVVDLQLADATACALLDDASVACWGAIAWHGRTEDVLRPTGVLGVIGVKQIFVLPGRACARVANESLVCWGNVDARGHFATGAAHRVPTPVVGLDHVAGMTASGAFSDDGRVWRWGSDGIPHRLDATAAQEIAARDGAVCARLDGGRVVCADTGRCGPSPTSPASPQGAPSHTAPPAPAKTVKPGAHKAAGAGKSPAPRVAAGKPGTTGKPAVAGKSGTEKPGATKPGAGKPAASADPTPAGEPVLSPGFATARQLAFDVGFCVVTTNGRLQCGDGCRKLDPIALERVDAVVGRCARLKAGTVSCFDGSKFVAVPGIERATQLAVGRAHACALIGDDIRCWGDREHGQLGGFAIPP